MKEPKAPGKAGRPGRGDLPQRVTLYLSLAAKRKLAQLAFQGGTSMSGMLEGLIERQCPGPEAEGQGDGAEVVLGRDGTPCGPTISSGEGTL